MKQANTISYESNSIVEEIKMTNEERVLNQFLRKDVDYLPSQITFSERSRDKQIAAGLGIEAKDLDAYLQNHIAFTFSKDDLPLFFHNDDFNSLLLFK